MKRIKLFLSTFLAISLTVSPVYTYSVAAQEITETEFNNVEESTQSEDSSISACAEDGDCALDAEGNENELELNDSSNSDGGAYIPEYTDTEVGIEDEGIESERNIIEGKYREYSQYNKNVSNSLTATITSEKLTVILRGLNEENYENTYNALEQYIQDVLKTEKSLTLKDSNFIDAEKFNVKQLGYDEQHCWAATAANILWTTGYAKEAINPLTNQKFNSEDEVLTYFSENFTDNAGSPAPGISWFFSGDSNYPSSVPSQLKLDTSNRKTDGLLPDKSLDGISQIAELANNPSAISIFESLDVYGVGVLVRWVLEDGSLTSGAHWMTAVGSVIDYAIDGYDKYKAIILANSDNNPVNGNISGTTASEKTAEKSKQDNTYTAYKLTYSENQGWVINGFSSRPTVITYLYWLMDSDKHPEGDVDENNSINIDSYNFANVYESDIDVSESSTDLINADLSTINKIIDELNKKGSDGALTEVYVLVENNKIDSITDINSFYGFTAEQLETTANIQKLEELMIKNLMPVFTLSNGKIVNGRNYEVYITASKDMIGTVSIDGVAIPPEETEIVSTNSGLSKLVIKSAYLEKLTTGKHVVSISINGSDIPTVFEIEK